MELDDQVCYCFHISKRKILNHLRIYKPRVASQLSDCGGAGSGCGWCIPFLKRYFAEAQANATAPSDEISPAEYAQARAQYVRSGKGKPPPGATPLPDAPASPPEIA